ncbi:hypothetical protein [Marinobacter halophilus]|nr:hypothetical protein [Marinobacter halophilus]
MITLLSSSANMITGLLLLASALLISIRIARWKLWHCHTRPDLLVLAAGLQTFSTRLAGLDHRSIHDDCGHQPVSGGRHALQSASPAVAFRVLLVCGLYRPLLATDRPVQSQSQAPEGGAVQPDMIGYLYCADRAPIYSVRHTTQITRCFSY